MGTHHQERGGLRISVPLVPYPSSNPSSAIPSSAASPFLSSCAVESFTPLSSWSEEHLQIFNGKFMSLDSEPPETQLYGDIGLSPEQANSLVAENKPAKRGRGRPRKHEVRPPNPAGRPTNGRSKTGCFTCRKRKKKCDETGFPCLNCQRTAKITCEGYPSSIGSKAPSRNILQAYKEPRSQTPALPQFIPGVENDSDRHLLNHFNYHLSKVLSADQDDDCPFNKILLPMALKHRGLMHSILCLSATHCCRRDPSSELCKRREHHRQEALKSLINSKEHTDNDFADHLKAQALVLCVESTFSGNKVDQSQYGIHLDYIANSTSSKSQNEAFAKFLGAFRVYSDACDSITSLDRRHICGTTGETFDLPWFVESSTTGTFLGVHHHLFWYLARITALRDQVRFRRRNNLFPAVDGQILSDAQSLDIGLKSWKPKIVDRATEKDIHRHTVTMLYQQCIWIYLYRTCIPSAPDSQLHQAVEEGLEYLSQLPSDSFVTVVLLLPLFLLGCAAFDATHREQLRRAFRDLKTLRESGNIDFAGVVVERVWQMMDEGDEESWDWETMIHNMGWSFLIT